MALRELGAMGNCGCAGCLRTYSRREYYHALKLAFSLLSQLFLELDLCNHTFLNDTTLPLVTVTIWFNKVSSFNPL